MDDTTTGPAADLDPRDPLDADGPNGADPSGASAPDTRPVGGSRIFRGTPEAEAARRRHEDELAARHVAEAGSAPVIDADVLRRLCLDAGAADVGFVEVDRPALGDEADHARRLFPATRTLVSLIGVTNADAIRSPSRATANLAWKHCHHELDEVADRVRAALRPLGVRGVLTSIGFPMDSPEPGDLPWQIAHKVVAVEAGMGHMGVHRNVIHPRFGNFVLLETLLIDAEVRVGLPGPVGELGSGLAAGARADRNVGADAIGAVANAAVAAVDSLTEVAGVTGVTGADAAGTADGGNGRSPYGQPLEYNPCNGCNLCVAACPVGAVRPDDDFDFFACLGHNYREFLFGAADWVDALAGSSDTAAYRSKFREDETRSMWQSLAFGPNYKAAYCMAVCPAGDDVISPYLADRAQWRRDVALPLIRKPEAVYVQSGTRAEKVARRNKAKRVRYLDYRPDVSTPANLVLGARHMFDPARADGVHVRLHLRLPDGEVTLGVDDGELVAEAGFVGAPDAVLDVTAPDYITLLQRGFATEGTRPAATATGAVRYELAGDPAALGAFLACLD